MATSPIPWPIRGGALTWLDFIAETRMPQCDICAGYFLLKELYTLLNMGNGSKKRICAKCFDEHPRAPK